MVRMLATKIGSMNAQTWNSCIVCGAQLAVEVVDEKWCISEFMTLLWALLNIVSVKCQFLVSTLRLGGLASLFFSRFLFCFLRDLQEFMPSNLFCVFKKPPSDIWVWCATHLPYPDCVKCYAGSQGNQRTMLEVWLKSRPIFGRLPKVVFCPISVVY